MTRPRILQVVSHLDLGGAERVAWNIATGLENEFEFAVHAIRGTAANAFGKAFETEVLARGVRFSKGPNVPMRRGGVLTGGWSLLQAARAFRPDVIHIHTEIPESSLAAASLISRTLRRTPCVRTIHNSKIWFFAPRLGAFCERRLTKASCAAVSPSALNALHLSRATAGLGPDPARESVITNGIAVPRVRERRPFSCAPRLVFGGRFEHEKGADLLPEIVSKVRIPEGMTPSLDVFGQGTFDYRLRALAANPPRGWSIMIHPPAPDFVSRLADYDIALLPSRFEGLSLFGIEASMSGLAVVATDAKGLCEVLPRGYPLQTPIEDIDAFAGSLTRLLADPAAFEPAVVAAQARARELFGLEWMLADYRALYHSLLTTPRTQ